VRRDRLACAAAALLALGAGCALAAPAVGAGPEAADAGGEELSAEDLEAVRGLLDGLARAMRTGDAEALGGLLASSLPEAESRGIVSRARREFDRLVYRRFACELGPDPPCEPLAPGRVEMLVRTSYEYESRSEGGVGMAGTDRKAYRFIFERSANGWGIAGSDLFEEFTGLSFGRVFGWIFLAGFAGALVVFFWGWMAFDAWMRTGRARYGLLILVSTPVGAGFYFFAVYFRRRFHPRARD
jgi:hypothetical protein